MRSLTTGSPNADRAAGCTTLPIQRFVAPTIRHLSFAGVENATLLTADTFQAFSIPQAPLPSTLPSDTASATDCGSTVHWPDGGRTPTVVKLSVRFGVDEHAVNVARHNTLVKVRMAG